MHADIEKVLLSEAELSQLVARLAQEITADYAGKAPLMVAVLQGAVVFFTDLLRQIPLPVDMDFMAVSSYFDSTESSGKIHFRLDVKQDIRGRDVILVEDILDTGNTLSALLPILWERQPASLKLCVLLDKPERRQKEVPVDYVGTTIPDAFVVGYGLDYQEHYRTLPYVGILKEAVYRK